jgi:hypothetical protein
LVGCIKYINDDTVKNIAFLRAQWLHTYAIHGLLKLGESDSIAHQFFLSKQAKAARRKRAANPRENALMAAIEAELGTSPILRPNKEAEAMLDAVNLRLGAGGFGPVKVDVVRRRLETRAALLKSAEKVPE